MSRKKRSVINNNLDLHGVKHMDVDILVENHVLINQLPLTIITGHSFEMKRIVIRVLNRHEFKYMDGIPHNMGCIVVLH